MIRVECSENPCIVIRVGKKDVEKYHDERTAICIRLLQKFPLGLMPKRAPKGDYGTVHMLPVISLFDNASRRHGSVVNDEPICFEDMDQNQGLMLYETHLPPIERDTKLPLVVQSLRDRAIVFLNGVCCTLNKYTHMY